MAVNNYIHSTNGIMGVVNILGVFCLKTERRSIYTMLFYFKTTQRGNRGRGGYVRHPSGGGHCVKFLRPAVAVWIVSALRGAAPVDPF